MFEEDRNKVMDLYTGLFDSVSDTDELEKALMSPTRQAVILARVYDAPSRKAILEGSAEETETPEFMNVIKGVFDSVSGLMKKEAEEEPAEDSADAPVASEADIAEEDAPAPEEEAADMPAEATEEEEAVEELLEDFERSKAATVEKTCIPLLILYILLAIPVGVVLVALMLVFAAAFLALAAGAGATGILAVKAAVEGGFALISDILVVAGLAVVLLAAGLLLLWAAVWFISGAIPGIIRGIISLGGRWCVREVEV